MLFGFIAGRTSERWSASTTLVAGLVMCLAGAIGLVLTAAEHLPLIAMILSLFTLVSGVATTTPPSTSLALQNYPDVAGSAASLLGLARFALGGLSAPLVGVAGAHTAVPLGLVALGATLFSVLGYTLMRPPRVP
jgi:DHA1 family bicyclomycin/chloramphenicol resistance-like MFS transporter